MRNQAPADHGLPGSGWNVKKVRLWAEERFQVKVSVSLIRRILKGGRLSWKKCRKVLRKADPEKRRAYIELFAGLYEQMTGDKVRLVYVDEAHIHRDMQIGYTWATTGQPAWRISHCPPLADRINWYGAYDFSTGQVFIWNEGACNSEHMVQFLTHLADWLGPSDLSTIVIWDGAPWHRSRQVQRTATDLGFIVMPLPGYSPDLNPIEGLWKWMREEVTQHICYISMRHLFDACKAFVERINQDPVAVVQRLWPKFELHPDYEKLLVS